MKKGALFGMSARLPLHSPLPTSKVGYVGLHPPKNLFIALGSPLRRYCLVLREGGASKGTNSFGVCAQQGVECQGHLELQ